MLSHCRNYSIPQKQFQEVVSHSFRKEDIDKVENLEHMVNQEQLKEVYKRRKDNQEANRRWIKGTYPLPSPPSQLQPTSISTSQESTSRPEIDQPSTKLNDDFNFDIKKVLKDAKVNFPLSQLMRIPSVYKQVREYFQETMNDDILKDPPIILQSEEKRKETRGGAHPHFFMTLDVNEYILHNCMLDTGASSNVMPLNVMRQLGL